MATNANMGGLLGGSAPGSTPWWTDQEAQQSNGSVSNLPTYLRGMSPQYLAALRAIGYTGGDPNAPVSLSASQSDAGLTGHEADDAALQAFLQSKGLTSKTSFVDGPGAGNQNSALFDAQGNIVPGTQRNYASDSNEDAFLGAMLLGGGFAGAAAAGAGVAGGGLATDATGATVSSGAAGAGYGGAGAAWTPTAGLGSVGGATNAVNFATDPSFLGTDSAVDGAGGAALQEGALPASLGGTSGAGGAGGLLGSGSGLLGSSVTGGQLMSGAGNLLTSKAGGALLGAVAGGLGSGSGLNSATNTTQNKIDPRLAQYIYGPNGTSGLLGNVNSLYNQQMATGGLNANQTAGLNNQLAVLNNPNYTAGFDQAKQTGMGLLSAPQAGNPFTSGQVTLGQGNPTVAGRPMGMPAYGNMPPPYQQQPRAGIQPVAPGGLLGR